MRWSSSAERDENEHSLLHLVNQLHTSAKMKSADAVLAALAEGIWKDVCLGCNATFHLETY